MTSALRSMAGVSGPVHLNGWIPDTKDAAKPDPVMAPPASGLPVAHTLRPNCPPVRDQTTYGTCTCNSTAEAMGFLYVRAGHADPIFARFFLYWFVRQMEGTAPTDDSGAQIRDVMQVAATRGVPPESLWPYVDENFATTPTQAAQDEAQKHKALFFYRCPNLATIKGSIAQGFPVVIGFQVPENMDSAACANTGIVQYPAPGEKMIGGHAVLAVGYDDKTGLVCFQNSWGTGWGDRGFGYLPYRMFTDAFVADCWTLRLEQM